MKFKVKKGRSNFKLDLVYNLRLKDDKKYKEYKVFSKIVKMD